MSEGVLSIHAKCRFWFVHHDGPEMRGYPCDRAMGHDGEHWNEAIRGTTHGHEVPRDAESADTRIQAAEPSANGCAPLCGCPPGWHSERNAFVEGTWEGSDGTKCNGCDSTILPGVRHQYNFQTRESYHLGCWASKQWHEERGLPFPPERGQNDGKALNQAAEGCQRENAAEAETGGTE